ncbi:GNAT family N-acetyltransferase [Iodobacter sp. LRB]|uniref:GNAT family N-acetyltransferase n=1 Tax=unclassified Iodobacter TaxID=235634 RepID=UPI0015D512D4|nr:GNAT family N-acetyltransferase [Iodobacter sp. BJB302]
MPQLNIRPMTIHDAAAVSALLPALDYTGSPCDVERRFAALSAQPDHVVFLAFHNEQLAGLCHIQGVRLIASDGYAEISALVVSTALQRSGIGKALVCHAKDWAISKGYERLRLRSGLHRENAHLFYEAIGFSKKKASYAFEIQLSDSNHPL